MENELIISGRSNLWLGIIQQLREYKNKWYIIRFKSNEVDEFLINDGDIYTKIDTSDEICKRISNYYNLDENLEFEIYSLNENLAKNIAKNLKKFSLDYVLLNLKF
jgi:hypothetical protein